MTLLHFLDVYDNSKTLRGTDTLSSVPLLDLLNDNIKIGTNEINIVHCNVPKNNL